MATLQRQTTIIVLFSALTVLASMGIRQSFGLFLQPISDSLGLGREVFSLAIALQNVVFGLPLFGMIADRYGARWVVFGGALLYAAGCLLVPASSGPLGLYLTLGLIIGLGLGSTTYVVVLGAVARVVHPANRSTVFGIVTAAGFVWHLRLSARGAVGDCPRRLASVLCGQRGFNRLGGAVCFWLSAPVQRTRGPAAQRGHAAASADQGTGPFGLLVAQCGGSSSAVSTSLLSPRICLRSSPTVACRA